MTSTSTSRAGRTATARSPRCCAPAAAIGTPSPTASPTCRGRRPRGRLVEVTGRQEYAGADPNGWNIAREVSADAADHRNAPHGTATHRTAPRRVGTAPRRVGTAPRRVGTAPRRVGTAPAPHRAGTDLRILLALGGSS
ncbi:hypothetical protein [Streptomyces scabiei]|uniref:hypothetical protein n=1 Tax=Streptomyces scabiei TaxID=1930 RepID=UPI00117CDDF8|nr:hypothetical protein [Streptomyces scabiei]